MVQKKEPFFRLPQHKTYGLASPTSSTVPNYIFMDLPQASNVREHFKCKWCFQQIYHDIQCCSSLNKQVFKVQKTCSSGCTLNLIFTKTKQKLGCIYHNKMFLYLQTKQKFNLELFTNASFLMNSTICTICLNPFYSPQLVDRFSLQAALVVRISIIPTIYPDNCQIPVKKSKNVNRKE